MAQNGKQNVSDTSLNNCHKRKKPFIIGVCGGTSSGKTTVCSRIMDKLGETERSKVEVIEMDSFYKTLSSEELEIAKSGNYNFDHPDAFDIDLLKNVFQKIKANDFPIKIPKYNKDNFKRSSENDWKNITKDSDVILFPGILAFYFSEIRDSFDMKLFVDSDADTRLSRRVIIDTEQRKRSLETVLKQYKTFVKPAFDEFCMPTKQYADVIIPRGADNNVAVDLIVQHIQDLMKSKSSISNNRDRHNSDSMYRPH